MANPIFGKRKTKTINDDEIQSESRSAAKQPLPKIAPPITVELANGRTPIKEVAELPSDAKRADMEKVRQHQLKLNKYGANLEVDGMWGAKTEAASRDLYPKYKAQPKQSTPTSKASVFKPKTSVQTLGEGIRTVKDSKDGKSYPLQTDKKGSYYVKPGTPAVQGKAVTKSSNNSVFKAKGAPTEPEYEMGFLDQFGNDPDKEGKRARDAAKKQVYETQLKAYQVQLGNKAIDDSDSIKVANGLDPSRRYKSRKFEEELDRQVKASRDGNTALFNKEYERQAKGFVAGKVIESYRKDADKAEGKPYQDAIKQNKANVKEFANIAANSRKIFKRDSTATRGFRDDADSTAARESRNRKSDDNWSRIKASADSSVRAEKPKTFKSVSTNRTNRSGGQDTTDTAYRRVFAQKKARKEAANQKTQDLLKRARSKGIRI